jgi:hypothetical protein
VSNRWSHTAKGDVRVRFDPALGKGRQCSKLLRMRQLLVSTVVVSLAAGAGFVLAQAPAKKGTASTSAPAPAPPPRQPARLSTPPIPTPGFAAGRPVDQARAVYEFAGQHPEILKYVPCYCGCESDGHPHNESCFVKSRDAKGNVIEWDTHGYG